jgi:hypothetical protein
MNNSENFMVVSARWPTSADVPVSPVVVPVAPVTLLAALFRGLSSTDCLSCRSPCRQDSRSFHSRCRRDCPRHHFPSYRFERYRSSNRLSAVYFQTDWDSRPTGLVRLLPSVRLDWRHASLRFRRRRRVPP